MVKLTQTIRLNVFDHFVGLALKELRLTIFIRTMPTGTSTSRKNDSLITNGRSFSKPLKKMVQYKTCEDSCFFLFLAINMDS